MHAAFCLEPNIQQAPRFYCYVASGPRSRKMPTKPVASLLLFAATYFRPHGLTRKKKKIHQPVSFVMFTLGLPDKCYLVL